ncbi:MAG: hypothetical protein ACUZ8E_16260 [Candidatus Anammoxibacter sp.]
MKMFLVGMCDIFLILYLTTLSQVSPYQNSTLTVDDYNKVKEAETLAISETERLKEMRLKLEIANYALEKEKDYALLSVQYAEIKNKTALGRIEAFENEIKIGKEAEAKALEVINSEKEKVLRIENALTAALKDEEEVGKLLQSAREEKTIALQRLEDAYLKEQIAIKNEKEALLAAEEAKKEAEKAKKNEDKALKLAKEAQSQKEVALQNERAARSAESKALEVASAAKDEATETRLQIRTITQTADNAFNENISDKLVNFTVTIEYKNLLNLVNKKEITMHGIPVKIENNYLIFVLLDQIGLRTALAPDKYVSYNITVDDNPITELYVKSGANRIAALALNSEVKHSVPLGKIDKFSSYMPVLISIHSRDELSVMDRIRKLSGNFFIFKRDHLRMISDDELYYGNEGIRGTRDFAEYIKKGDHIVDLGGNFIGLAYKKNTIIRINQIDGWHKITINKTSARGLAKRVREVISS